ncbi:MAG: tetratricopeptide repeat protein [Chitinophagaceae bacterium]|nr:tetratricopeptide repeat protein [Chitinophagaceae bacterium]
MHRNQYFLLSAAILLFAGLYFFGNTKGEKKTKEPTQSAGHESPPMAGPMSNIEPINMDTFIQKATSSLTETENSKFNSLQELASKEPSAIHFKDLAEFWEAKKQITIAANYYKKAAFLENTEKSITFAGNLLMAVMQKTEEPAVKKWQSLEAIECFNKALELNGENTDTKVALATCYTEGTGETMKGVTLLREVTQKDSNNVPANLLLGKLAIQSGQLDKAIRRLELVLTIQPKNTEAMYFLAEAYKNKGDKPKAISLLENCKRIVNSPEFSKEIDQYINSFK